MLIATAGHVDHGKSTLVTALTGTDPDRWAEEKRRGMTIDLGFASAVLPSGREVSFVDVPGHVRFLRNMIAGAGAVEACLFVVAATEGWKPQSEEHLRILELLGVDHAVVALTKVGLVDDETRALAHLDLDDHLTGSALDGAEVIEVDAPTGIGVADLTAALDRLAVPPAGDAGRPRLWVDRAFAFRGAGTVVTGSLAGGSLGVHDEVVVEPLGRAARVRGLQRHGSPVERMPPGSRTAVNLLGVDHREVARGDAIVQPNRWHRATTVDVSLTVLPALDHEVGRRGAYLAHIGSGEHAVALRVLGSEAIEPGATGCVRLHLPGPLPLLPGDRYVLREAGRAEVVGGGEVLDVSPVLRASRARPDRSVERVVAERGWVDADELERLTGERIPPTVGSWVVAPDALAAAEEQVRHALAAAGDLGLDVATLDERHRAILRSLPDVEVDAGRAGARAGLEAHPYLAALAASPYQPPAPDGVDRAELHELVRRGLVAERDGSYFSPSAVEGAAREVARLLAASPDGVTVADVRDALGTTRKHVLPLLALLDATGVTRRRGDRRIGGPRLPTA